MRSRSQLTVIGVRHHSPACAALVKRVIAETRPAFVLIEGPSDFNPHMGDLRLEHRLPIAIFSFLASETETRASYAPFCAYSPEWQALRSAWAAGAEALFCDLPAWDKSFGDRANRYADPHSLRARRATHLLGEKLGEDGADALWDALAEQRDSRELPAVLDGYFELLRPGGAEDASEAAREAFMGRTAAWAMDQAGGRPVVLVCGGWHAEAIRRIARETRGTELPQAHPPEGARTGSYVVPYDYGRLDRFTGYAAGMPSPAYYETVAEEGLAQAADWAASRITEAMRKARQVVSTADRVAWTAQAQALAAARGHRAVLRSDLLDAALSTLVKDALDLPANWRRPGALRAGSHPALVAMLGALTGNRRGKLASGTRQPPLVADVEARLAELDLVPSGTSRTIPIDWNAEGDRPRAHVLHALLLLGIPGIEREGGAGEADTRAPRETFRISPHRDRLGALIEASRWGGALPMAAAALIASRLEGKSGDLAALGAALGQALFAGLIGTHGDLLNRLEEGMARAHDIRPLGKSGLHVARLYRFGAVFGQAAHLGLGRIASAFFHRFAWLAEGIEDPDEGFGATDAMLAARDLLRDCPELRLDRQAFSAVLARILANKDAAPALAGASLGCRIALGEDGSDAAAKRIRRFAQPQELGDFLSGLFALAREELAESQSVLDAVSGLVEGWSDPEFLSALPAMRQAFSWFPPRERERLARAILRSHGFGEGEAEVAAIAWMRQRVGAESQAAALALEASVAERLGRAGLH